MDKVEAGALLQQRVRNLRAQSYKSLQAFIEPVTIEVEGPSGAGYQLEVQAFWDDEEGGNLRVIASIDDMGLRALSPMSDDFIKASDDSFVGE
jgi:hypothetical protein